MLEQLEDYSLDVRSEIAREGSGEVIAVPVFDDAVGGDHLTGVSGTDRVGEVGVVVDTYSLYLGVVQDVVEVGVFVQFESALLRGGQIP